MPHIGDAQTTPARDTLFMTLDSCLSYAYSHNITVQTSVLDQAGSEAAYQGAIARFTPSLSASASENASFRDGTSTLDGNYGVNASLTLFNGFNNLNNLRSADLTRQQSTLRIQQSQNNIGSQIISAYLTIVMSNERMAYLQEVLRTTGQQKQEGELKYSVGRLLESEYLLLEANYVNALNNIEDLRLTIESNLLTLRSLLCMTDNRVIGVDTAYRSLDTRSAILPQRDSAVAMSLRHLPDLRISQLGVDIAQLNVKMSASSFYPTLTLGGGASYYGGNSNVVNDQGTLVTQGGINGNASLSLNIPILNRGTSRQQYKQSKIQLQEAQLQHSQTAIDLQSKVEGQYISVQQSLGKFASSEALMNAYRANYDVYVIKYEQGAVTTVDMLQQQDRYMSALNDYLQNKYSYILQEKLLKIYMGD